jgi:Super-infection exclusion protein B
MLDPSKWLDALKAPPRILLIVVLAGALLGGFLLYGPSDWVDASIAALVATNRPYIVVAFLVFSFIAVVSLLVSLAEWIFKSRNKSEYWRDRRQSLHSLTEDEKAILRKMMGGHTRTVSIAFSDGVGGSLEARHIIVRTSNVFNTDLDEWELPYTTQPWAEDYLKKHPELLAPKPGANER